MTIPAIAPAGNPPFFLSSGVGGLIGLFLFLYAKADIYSSALCATKASSFTCTIFISLFADKKANEQKMRDDSNATLIGLLKYLCFINYIIFVFVQ